MGMPMVVAGHLGFLLLDFHVETDRSEERLEMLQQVLLGHPSVEVQEIQELPLHQIHLGQSESKAIESLDRCISCPMFVLRARIVQVLSREDQGSQEDAVNGASHAFGHGGESGAEAGQVDQGGHQCRHLDGRSVHKGGDELLQAR